MLTRRAFIKTGVVAAGAAALHRQAKAEQPRAFTCGVGGYNYRLPSFKKGSRLLFQGDSITDMKWGRRESDRNHYLGHSYVYLIAARLGVDMPEAQLDVYNRGNSGNSVAALRQRWQRDAIDMKPDVLSILIGTNDVGQGLRNPARQVTPAAFESDYRSILDASRKANPALRLVLLDPFVLPTGGLKNDQAYRVRREATDKLRVVVAQLAKDYDAVHIKTQDVFDVAADAAGAEQWMWDGIHPLPQGHELIARHWLQDVSAALAAGINKMKRLDFPKAIFVAAAICTLTNNIATATADTPNPSTSLRVLKPNIVYIMMDEWGYYEWSAMGHPILRTPNIDRLAAEGMRFTQFLAGANVCAPTRSTLMTGQHTGHTTVRGPGCLRADDVTIASILKDAGYATGGFGKWGLGDAGTTGVPEKHGFDTFFGYYNQTHAHTYYPRYLIRNSQKVPLEGNTGDFLEGKTFSHSLIYAESLKFIRENKDRPFFAYLPWTPPHGFWAMPEDDPAWQKYKEKEWDATNQRGTHDAQMYAAMVEMVDRQIGEIMALLKELKIDDHTIVFVSGDNGGKPYFKNNNHPHGFLAPNLNPKTGERFRGGKGNFYEGGLRIPFIVRWPGKIKAGSVSDHLGYFPDVMPTLAEITGAKPRKDTDGISIIPTLLGEKQAGRKQEQHEYLYWEDPQSCAVRMNNWKAIRPGKGVPFELYDLSQDLEELNDIAAQHPDILEKMKLYAKEAHTPVRIGKVLDASLGFKGHKRQKQD